MFVYKNMGRLLALIFICLFCGCSGPSKTQLKVLLHQARTSNRECHRMLKAYEGLRCSSHPEQGFGSDELNVGGIR